MGSVRRPRRVEERTVQTTIRSRYDQSLRGDAPVTTEPVIPISAIEHCAYCPRKCALIHCDGIWSNNAHTVVGKRVHRRVDSGHHRKERGKEVLSFHSPVVGSPWVVRSSDAVEMKDGAVCPVEYTSGVRHGIAADMQVCAQALVSRGHAWN